MAHLVLHARRPPLPSTPASIPGYQPDNQTHQPPIPPFNGLESAPASASAPAPASAPHLPPRPPSEYYQQPPPVSYGQYPDHTQVVHDFQRLSVTSPPPPQLPHQRVTVVQQQHGTMEQISGGYTASVSRHLFLVSSQTRPYSAWEMEHGEEGTNESGPRLSCLRCVYQTCV